MNKRTKIFANFMVDCPSYLPCKREVAGSNSTQRSGNLVRFFFVQAIRNLPLFILKTELFKFFQIAIFCGTYQISLHFCGERDTILFLRQHTFFNRAPLHLLGPPGYQTLCPALLTEVEFASKFSIRLNLFFIHQLSVSIFLLPSIVLLYSLQKVEIFPEISKFISHLPASLTI